MSFLAPLIIFVVIGSFVISTFSSYFGSSRISDNISDEENKKLLDYSKELILEKSKEFKDYYGTDKNYVLQYQYIIGYLKYMCADQESKGQVNIQTFDELKASARQAINELWPKMTYKQDSIIIIREYKVIVKKFNKFNVGIKVFYSRPDNLDKLNYEKIYIYQDNVTLIKEEKKYYKEVGKPKELIDVQLYKTRPDDLKADEYEKDQKIYIIDTDDGYIVNEEEETRIDRKEEIKSFVTNIRSIKASINFTYEIKTDVLEKENEKVTTIRPVLKDMKQIDQNWDYFKEILVGKYDDEDIDQALEMILASSAALVSDKVNLDMIYTGGGSGVVTPEEFTGDQEACVKKIYEEGAKELYEKYNILPSITIAQATIESDWGQSGLTVKANNLFGVKAFSDWTGATVEMITAEDDGNGNKFEIVARFRAYNSWKESIEDYGRVILQPNFQGVRDAKDYRGAAMALRGGGYATDINYVNLIINRIEAYKLYEYDKK